MSGPPSGRYIIYNRLLAPRGAKLALTFNSLRERNLRITASPLTGARNQIWNLDADEERKYYGIASDTDDSFHLFPGLSHSGPYVDITASPMAALWTLKEEYTGDFIIQNGRPVEYWSVSYASDVGGEISLTENDLGMGSRWVVEKVN